ncbi:MAG: LysR family transcriptional regulator [Candidatus Dactylopiibacterium sp.]|nr:LysR family transcriptional regulator [Candidatus Dactylopiibacterium sp.]
MRLTLRQVEVFSAVARHQSVSRAAEELAMSQSATSTALGELERAYDHALFDRVGKSLRLNEIGAMLLPAAVELLDQAAQIENLLEGRAGFGLLRIGATLTIGNYLATLIVGQHLQRHPESRVELQVHNSARIIQQIANFELDLGLVEGDCSHRDLVVTPWINDELAVFCAPGHRLAGHGPVPLAELARESWIMREQGSGTRQALEYALAPHQFRPDVRLELEHTEAIKRAVESGLGIGCISRLALREASRRGSLVLLEVPELNLRRRFNFVWHARKYQTPGLRAFLDECHAFTAGARRSDEIELPYIP